MSAAPAQKDKTQKFIKAIKSDKTTPAEPITMDTTEPPMQPNPAPPASSRMALDPPTNPTANPNTRSQTPPSDPNIRSRPPHMGPEDSRRVIQHGNNPSTHTDREVKAR